MPTDFDSLRKVWSRLGEIDPLWAVLSDDTKIGGRWDLEEFFLSGRVEVDAVLARVDEAVSAAGGRPPRGRALDFGCGVGRISQGLGRHFAQVTGVDIAPSMLELAAEHNRLPHVQFQLSPGELLETHEDGSFDLVYTAHVLQHMEPRYAERYVAEFLRVLAPGGVAMVEVVTEPVTGAAEALPDAAFAYEMEVVAAPFRLQPGATGEVRLVLRNTSPEAWPSLGTEGWFLVTVGGHWRAVDDSGHPQSADPVEDPHRCHLPADVPAGGSVELTLPVTAPEETGRYRLDLDAVQEGVAWFASKGCAPTQVRLRVAAATGWRAAVGAVRDRSSRGRAPEPEYPAMEMHGISDDDMRQRVSDAGGRVLISFDWDEVSRSRSTDWHRRGYVIVKDAAAVTDPA